MNPNTLPGKFSQNIPIILHSISGFVYLFAIGCQQDPAMATEYGVPSVLVGVVIQGLGVYLGKSATTNAAKAIPDHLAPGGELDHTAVVAELMADAFKKGNGQLVDALSKLPIGGKP